MFKKVLIALAALLIVPTLLVSVFKLSPSKWLEPGKPQSKYDLSPSEVKKRVKAVEDGLPKIEALLEQAHYLEAHDLLYALFNAQLYTLKNTYGQQSLGDDRTVSSELERMEIHIGEAVRRSFDQLVAQIDQGGRETTTLQWFVGAFPNVGHNNLAQELAARMPELDRKRAMLATRWIRILYERKIPDFDEAITAFVNKTILPSADYALVHSPALGPAEAAATFATITVEVAPDLAGYDLVIKTTRGNNPPEVNFLDGGALLTGLKVTLRLHTAFAEYYASWDNISPAWRPANASKDDAKVAFTYTMPGPEGVGGRSVEDLREDFRKRNHDRLGILKDKLARDLAEIPVLDFIPDRNSPPPPVSRQAALLDQPKFIQVAAAELAANKSIALITHITAELCIEPLAGEVEKHLGDLTPEERRQLALILKTRPWFHEDRITKQLSALAPPRDVIDVVNLHTLDLKQDPAKLESILRDRPLADLVPVIVRLAKDNRNPPARETPGNPPSASAITLLEFLQKPDRASAARYVRQQSQGGNSENTVRVSKAYAEALNFTVTSGHVVLVPEELAFFLQVLETTRGAQREEALASLPRSVELAKLLVEKPQPAWDGAQSIALFRFAGPMLGTEENDQADLLINRLIESYKSGLFKTPKLLEEAKRVFSSYYLQNYFSRQESPEGANRKIALMMQMLDARTPEDLSFYAGPLGNMLRYLDVSVLLKNPNARAFLIKGKTYPDKAIQTQIRELIGKAGKINPIYRTLL